MISDELIDEVFALNGTTQWIGDFDYDPQGNLTRSERGDTTIEYEYDIRNRLASATNTTDAVTTTAEYQYDHDGMQVRRTETGGGNSATEFLIRDPLSPYGYSRVFEKRTPSGILLASFVHGREPIAEVIATSKHYLLADAHSGVRAIIDSSSNALQTVTYDSFGGLLSLAPTISSDHLYRTETFDSVSGQYYLRARHYTPSLTTFSQQDVFSGAPGNPVSLHRFQFADRDGTNRIDPSGMFTISAQLASFTIRANIEVAHIRESGKALGAGSARIIQQQMYFNYWISLLEEFPLIGVLNKASKYHFSLANDVSKNLPARTKNIGKLWTLLGNVAIDRVNSDLYQKFGVPLKLTGYPNLSGNTIIPGGKSAMFFELTGTRSTDGSVAFVRMLTKHPAWPAFYAATAPILHHHEVVGVQMYVRNLSFGTLGAYVHGPSHVGGVLYWEIATNRDYPTTTN